uniref:Succinate dehydrogenase assembly factor 3 n=1 Tax=Cacopsylla melanoneura TaxID=428564 RepID=A0A8D8LG75_9HEMI
MNQNHVQTVRLLYKTIQRLHRGLPPELQPLGINYARDEFKRHKTCNPSEAQVFMNEWTKYGLSLAEQLGIKGPKFASPLGQTLDEDALNALRDDQVAQLYDLMIAATQAEELDSENKPVQESKDGSTK